MVGGIGRVVEHEAANHGAGLVGEGLDEDGGGVRELEPLGSSSRRGGVGLGGGTQHGGGGTADVEPGELHHGQAEGAGRAGCGGDVEAGGAGGAGGVGAEAQGEGLRDEVVGLDTTRFGRGGEPGGGALRRGDGEGPRVGALQPDGVGGLVGVAESTARLEGDEVELVELIGGVVVARDEEGGGGEAEEGDGGEEQGAHGVKGFKGRWSV